MRLTLRLTLSLIVGITLIAAVFAYHQVQTTKREMRDDLGKRAEILAESLAANVEPLLEQGASASLARVVEQFGNRQRLAGVAIYGPSGSLLASTSGLAARPMSPLASVRAAGIEDRGKEEFRRFDASYMHIYALPLHRDGAVIGTLAIFHDATYIEAQSARLWRSTFLRVLVQTVFVALVILLIVQLSVTRSIALTVQRMRELRTGRVSPTPLPLEEDLFKPLVREVADLVAATRTAAEQEGGGHDSGPLWTAARLRAHVRARLKEELLCVVCNREPYMHVRRGESLETIVPAGGLVTALEPVLRACGGTWVAHGAGDADAEVVDAKGHVQVPPENPQYTLRRVWLTKQEEEGYYYGFSNEGLWPLCHIAHTRPIFRSTDWEQYQAVNQKFAQAALEEMAGADHPAVLIQDYHFALLPGIMKRARPDARVAIFWHIPWPNPQAFSICPWQANLVDGLLGADLVGFQIQAHCNYFLETVDQAVECRIDWERHAVERRGHVTLVRPFPISVAFSPSSGDSRPPVTPSPDRTRLLKELRITPDFLAVGVDRVDYTKGIIERFLGVERFLEKYPAYQGRFTLLQIGAPSRTHIKRYHDLLAQVEEEAERVNWRFQTERWKPILFLKRHHSRREIEEYYGAADLCLVTSLHDGMNLVAKEFVAARPDEQGVLILSRFTGAARELRDALIVNPYDTEQLAEAIRAGLEMNPEERGVRMRRLRRVVRERTVYRWAADLITELSELGHEMPPGVEPHAEVRVGLSETPPRDADAATED